MRRTLRIGPLADCGEWCQCPAAVRLCLMAVVSASRVCATTARRLPRWMCLCRITSMSTFIEGYYIVAPYLAHASVLQPGAALQLCAVVAHQHSTRLWGEPARVAGIRLQCFFSLLHCWTPTAHCAGISFISCVLLASQLHGSRELFSRLGCQSHILVHIYVWQAVEGCSLQLSCSCQAST